MVERNTEELPDLVSSLGETGMAIDAKDWDAARRSHDRLREAILDRFRARLSDREPDGWVPMNQYGEPLWAQVRRSRDNTVLRRWSGILPVYIDAPPPDREPDGERIEGWVSEPTTDSDGTAYRVLWLSPVVDLTTPAVLYIGTPTEEP
jgi:hypothetical protein